MNYPAVHVFPAIALIMTMLSAGLVSGQQVRRIERVPVRKLANLKHPEITESSGLACSHRTPDVFWTHNDSGGHPRLFAFDKQGVHRGTIFIDGARARDWEDMASFVLDEKPCLLLGDIGDNLSQKSHCTLYLVEEPDIDHDPPRDDLHLSVLQKVSFTYDDGPHNAEAVAFDPVEKTVILVTKEMTVGCDCYALAWPAESISKKNPIIARKVATTTFPQVTAIDITSDGRRAVMVTYGLTFEFVRPAGQAWGEVFGQAGRPLVTPFRRQGETVCFGPHGRVIYLTSERRPAPLYEMNLGRLRESP